MKLYGIRNFPEVESNFEWPGPLPSHESLPFEMSRAMHAGPNARGTRARPSNGTHCSGTQNIPRC
eukprot:1498554-Rhodomonas_salina.1